MDKFDRSHGVIFILVLTIPFSFTHPHEVNVSAESAVLKQSSQGAIVESIELIQRLKRTELINGDLTHERLNLVAAQKPRRRTKEFVTLDPFNPPHTQSFENLIELKYPIPPTEELYELNEKSGTFLFRGQESVARWFSTAESNADVCALRFEDDSEIEYQLRTFVSRNDAHSAGYVVTHSSHCGTCSSLKNLASYLENRDLTSAARSCGRKRNAKKIKTCLMNEVGFDEPCAETWTYNILHTTDHCKSICIKYYGFWNVLRGNMDKPHTDEQGKLNPCLQCDENTSGPGFQYVAGRTRRNSGVISAIHRHPEEIYSLDHTVYFDNE
ncbi:MAG: hypothetical protein F4W92_09555 [Gammaproteobacteria bacterium]|nr:hypothetical protein [Gammaproteobacteria bacterium]